MIRCIPYINSYTSYILFSCMPYIDSYICILTLCVYAGGGTHFFSLFFAFTFAQSAKTYAETISIFNQTLVARFIGWGVNRQQSSIHCLHNMYIVLYMRWPGKPSTSNIDQSPSFTPIILTYFIDDI